MDFSNPYVLGGLVLLGLVLIILTLRARTRSETIGIRVRAPGKFFLVLLRIAIGWHFLVEGLDKYFAPAWTSEPYLREATGPLAPKFREMAGDKVLDEATLGEGKTFPPALSEEWQAYLDAFAKHYQLTDAQQKETQRIFDQSKAETLTWMLKPQSVVKPSPVEPKITEELDIPKRAEQYRELRAKADEEEAELPRRYREAKEFAEEKARGQAMTKGEKQAAEKKWKEAVWKKWLDAKTDANKARGDLKKEIDLQTKAFKDALKAKLTTEQKAMPPLEEPVQRPIDWHRQLDVADNVVKYGLIAVGVCLILGAFTPLAAIAGALFLLMFFVAMPPLPYLPESPRAEGHYLYINKNIIEALALLGLAFLPTGRWAGLDGILQFLNPLNWRSSRASANLSEDRLAAARR